MAQKQTMQSIFMCRGWMTHMRTKASATEVALASAAKLQFVSIRNKKCKPFFEAIRGKGNIVGICEEAKQRFDRSLHVIRQTEISERPDSV